MVTTMRVHCDDRCGHQLWWAAGRERGGRESVAIVVVLCERCAPRARNEPKPSPSWLSSEAVPPVAAAAGFHLAAPRSVGGQPARIERRRSSGGDVTKQFTTTTVADGNRIAWEILGRGWQPQNCIDLAQVADTIGSIPRSFRHFVSGIASWVAQALGIGSPDVVGYILGNMLILHFLGPFTQIARIIRLVGVGLCIVNDEPFDECACAKGLAKDLTLSLLNQLVVKGAAKPDDLGLAAPVVRKLQELSRHPHQTVADPDPVASDGVNPSRSVRSALSSGDFDRDSQSTKRRDTGSGDERPRADASATRASPEDGNRPGRSAEGQPRQDASPSAGSRQPGHSGNPEDAAPAARRCPPHDPANSRTPHPMRGAGAARAGDSNTSNYSGPQPATTEQRATTTNRPASSARQSPPPQPRPVRQQPTDRSTPTARPIRTNSGERVATNAPPPSPRPVFPSPHEVLSLPAPEPSADIPSVSSPIGVNNNPSDVDIVGGIEPPPPIHVGDESSPGQAVNKVDTPPSITAGASPDTEHDPSPPTRGRAGLGI